MSGALDLLVVKLPDFVRTTTFRWISIAFVVCILLFSAFVYWEAATYMLARMDGVIAEDGALSRHLMAEDLAAEIARVLRPGGELLACVDSLVLGMAMLAEQRHWAHLTDLPHAEVVLIPWPDGTITRCFGAAQLYDLLSEQGLEVTSIRPRTVLSPSTVDHVLRQQPGAMARLVRAELQAGQDPAAGGNADEAFGISLVATARKPC